MPPTLTEEHIKRVIRNRWLVKFSRKPLEKYPLFGFILDYNEQFTLIHELDRDLFMLDGFTVFENKTVKDVWLYDDPDYFLSEVVRFEKIKPRKKLGISIESWSEIIRTASEHFPLVVIERESLERDICYIGKLQDSKRNTFVLREIDPDAEWDTKRRTYKFADLTKIRFGGRYETVLASVNEKRTLA